MAKLKNFKGSVPISSGLCGIGSRDYPLVQAHDIQVDEDGTRLDEVLGNGGGGLPEVTDADNGKVLTAENGAPVWKEPTGGGGGNANFIFADSVEELPDPSTVPENSVALVPSSGESGGGVKVIDLTKYSIEGQDTFNNLILALFAAGGGTIRGVDNSTFWADVSTSKSVQIAIDASAMIAGLTLESMVNNFTKSNGIVGAVNSSFLVDLVGLKRVTILMGIGNSGDNLTTSISVVVEQMVVPGN